MISGYIVIVVLLIVTLVLTSSTPSESESFNSRDSTRSIMALPAELLDGAVSSPEELQHVNEFSESVEAMVAEGLQRLFRIGDEVSVIQNSVMTMEDARELVDTLRSLAAYFDTSRLRFAWFTSRTDEISWRFVEPSFITDTEIPALWILENSDGRLLAYVRGTYLINSGEFVHMELVHLMSSVSYMQFENVERQGDPSEW